MKQFDLRDVIVTWGEHIIDGAGEGSFIKISYDEDATIEKVGGQGDVTVQVSANQKATATINLGQASSSNDKLSAAAALQRRPGIGLVKKPLTVRHINGTTLAFAAEAWIRKEAEIDFGDDLGDREWPLGLAKLEVFVGGSLR